MLLMATLLAPPKTAVAPPDEEPVAPPEEGTGGGEQRDLFQQGIDALTVADQEPFASPEYTAGVQAALPFFQQAAKTEGDLTEVAADIVQTLQEYLAVDWGPNPETRGDDGSEDAAEAPEDEDALLASAAPVEPPTEWFEDPHLSEPTGLIVTEEGRVYGHLSSWNSCHIASPNGADICVTAPRSARGYADFHTGAVRTKEGALVATGRITMNTGHAKDRASAADALGHYDHTGWAVADIRVGEDQHGIWVAGALRPDTTSKQRRALQGSPLSGDWRRIAGNLELVAALAVNVPGFGIPRPMGLVASANPRAGSDFGIAPDEQELMSLVAAGMILPRTVKTLTPAEQMERDARYLHRLAERERTHEKVTLRARVNRAKVAAFAARRKG